MLNSQCNYGCVYNGIEIKTYADKLIANPRWVPSMEERGRELLQVLLPRIQQRRADKQLESDASDRIQSLRLYQVYYSVQICIVIQEVLFNKLKQL